MKAKVRRGERRRAAAQMHALAAVRREIGSRDRASGRKYLREFSRAFQDYQQILAAQELHDRVAAADIVLIGDYHSLAASQRYAAGLVEQLAPVRPLVLAVEAVLSRDQAVLESWWRREISEDELRRGVRFDQDWGYDWTPFFELLTAARDHGEAIYGLDRLPRDDFRRIRSRDRHAAAKISEVRERHREARILVLFGESHLAPQHLPALVKQALPQERVLTVLQNIDKVYWKAVAQRAVAVAFNDEAVCVFNSTPLEKYESYRMAMAKWDGDDSPDLTPAVYNVIASIAQTLGFRLDSPQNGTQPKYLADSFPEVVTIDENSTHNEPVRHSDLAAGHPISPDHMGAMLEESGCIYVPETNTFFIREFRVAQVAAEATRFLYRACTATLRGGCSVNRKSEECLANFGSRRLCAQEMGEKQGSESEGDALYRDFLSGRRSMAAIRRMFFERL